MNPRPRAVIGVGQQRRRDGGVGLVVARALSGERLPRDVEILQERGFGVSLIAALDGLGFVVLVSAIDTGAPPGTVTEFGPEDLEDPAIQSEQLTALADCLSVAAQAFASPEVWCVAVQPKEVVPGTGLSLEVGEAVAEAVARVMKLLS